MYLITTIPEPPFAPSGDAGFPAPPPEPLLAVPAVLVSLPPAPSPAPNVLGTLQVPELITPPSPPLAIADGAGPNEGPPAPPPPPA